MVLMIYFIINVHMYVIITDNSTDYFIVLSFYLKYDTSVPNNILL